jgi:hypothetical protein
MYIMVIYVTKRYKVNINEYELTNINTVTNKLLLLYYVKYYVMYSKPITYKDNELQINT